MPTNDSDNPFLNESLVKPHMPWPEGKSTIASNPGRLTVNLLRWIYFRPLMPCVLLATVVVTAIAAIYSATLLAGLIVAVAIAALGAYVVWDHFRNGDANPGVVVALDPTLIAVATDLTQGLGEYPVIKIIEAKLEASAGKPLKIGDVVATIAKYSHPAAKTAGHWSDFDPIPADYATGDRRKIDRLLATFHDGQFMLLREGLKHIEQPYQPGLYLLWPESGKVIGRLRDY